MTATDPDDAYANAPHIPGSADYPPRWAAAAAAFRDALSAQGRAQLDIAYDDPPRCRLDLFLPEGAPEGLFVFVHGGYWRAFDKSFWSHLAAGALARGLAVALPSYPLAPKARISAITRHVARAIDHAAGLVAGPIRLAGHSAGGHLVTRMLCADMTWKSCFRERIRRVVSISGLHDLRPLVELQMNADLRLDVEEAAAESVVLHAEHLPVPVVAWVGGDERPVFIEQTRWLAQAWGNATAVIAPGRHHFDVIEPLAEPDSDLMGAVMGPDPD